MSRIEWLSVLVTGALPLVVLAGLVRRDRLRRCWMFPAYLASVAACNLAVAAWPERFFTWSTWLAADILQGALVLFVAAEITLRAFTTLPRGQRAARLALLVCLGSAFVVVLNADSRPSPLLSDLASDLASRLGTARAVAFLGLMAVVLYYELPLDDLHAAIVRGLALYSAAVGVGLVAVRDLGWDVRAVVSAALTSGYILLLADWTRAAWRDEPQAPAALRRRLWPWRS